MTKLLYYPFFDVKDENWLKFSILYLDELRPIIPDSGNRVLGSNIYEITRKETDLIKRYRPQTNDSLAATLSAIKEIDTILQNPSWFKDILQSDFILDEWRNPFNHMVEIHYEKYSSAFVDYCIKNRIGQYSNNGIRVPEDLARIYMSILAHYISDKEELPVITDDARMDRIALLLGKEGQKHYDYFKAVRNVIRLQLPADIENIDVMSLIEIRNSPDYKKHLRAFHEELQSFYNSIEDSQMLTAEQDFIDSMYSLKETIKSLTSKISILGLKTLNVGLSALISVKTSDMTPLLIAKETASFGEYSFGTVHEVGGFWKEGQSKKFCKKFLTDIQKVPTQTR